MSLSKNIKFNCEECGKEFEVEIHESINATLDPDLREKYLNGEIYYFECPHCGHPHYKRYPILYHDMDKKFMVQSGSLQDCLNFYYQTTNGINNIDEDMAELMKAASKDYVRTTAFSQELAKEKVVALENGLDHRLATIYRCAENEEYTQYAKENGWPNFYMSYLGYDGDGDLAVIYKVQNPETKKLESFAKKFEKELYDQVVEYFSKYLDDSMNYFFTNDVAYRLIQMDESELKIAKLFKYNLYLVEDYLGREFFVKTKSFDDKKYKKDDLILCINSKSELNKGCILEKIDFFNILSYPFDGEIPFIIGPLKQSFETSGDSNDEIDNDELEEALSKYKATKELPYDILRESDVILGMVSSVKIPIGKLSDSGEFVLDDILKEDNIDEFFNNNVRTYLITKEVDGKKYISVYLNQKSVPSEHDNNGVSKLICNFDDVILFCFSSFEKYAGIVIDPDGANIELSSEYLLNTYITDRTLSIDKRMIKLLEKLTEKEKKYLGDKELDVISNVYFDKKNPQIISKENGMEIEEVGELLSKGYSKLKDIVKYQFFKS